MSNLNQVRLFTIDHIYVLLSLLLIIILLIILHRNRAFPYKTTYLLTKNESVFYNTLKPVCDKYGYVICPKVGLKDFITVTGKKDYLKWFRKISQKHVDFLICDENLKPLMAIELDDSSHELKKARKNDEFKNKLYKHLNFPLVRIKSARYYRYQDLDSIISKIK